MGEDVGGGDGEVDAAAEVEGGGVGAGFEDEGVSVAVGFVVGSEHVVEYGQG